MERKILLKDVLNFDQLRKAYPNKRIKLRFNTSWIDINEKKETLYRNYLELYRSKNDNDKKFFRDSILSIGSEKKSRLSENDIVFQFIEISTHLWILVDVINITKQHGEKKGYNEFIGQEFEVAEGEKLNQYNAYCNRLIVKWSNKPQQFFYVQKEIVDEVKVEKIVPDNYFENVKDFTGYNNVSETYKVLKLMIETETWKNVLENVFGVYLITDQQTGKLYVGSATGEHGIYGRWKTYLEDGYDMEEVNNKEYPNKQLYQLVQNKGIKYIQDNFKYTILEIFSKDDIGRKKALERERHWKNVLETRKFGYNDN